MCISHVYSYIHYSCCDYSNNRKLIEVHLRGKQVVIGWTQHLRDWTSRFVKQETNFWVKKKHCVQLSHDLMKMLRPSWTEWNLNHSRITLVSVCACVCLCVCLRLCFCVCVCVCLLHNCPSFSLPDKKLARMKTAPVEKEAAMAEDAAGFRKYSTYSTCTMHSMFIG